MKYFNIILVLIALYCLLHIKLHTDKFEIQINLIEGQVVQLERMK